MKMTIRQALECIYLNKKMSFKVLQKAKHEDNNKMIIIGSTILLVNAKLKNKIDNDIKLSDEEKRTLSATPKMFKALHITPDEFRNIMHQDFRSDDNPFNLGNNNPWG